MSEQRSAPRITTRTRATVSDGRRSVAFTVDSLSLTGARLIGPLTLRQGQRVDIVLELDRNRVKVVGEVVRVDTPDLMTDQAAVRFVEIPPESRAVLRDVVRHALEASEPLLDADET